MVTFSSAFTAVAIGSPGSAFLAVPPSIERSYLPDGAEISFGAIRAQADEWAQAYAASGYGHGHRAVLLLDNQPEFFVQLLALNALGISIVPLSSGAHARELAYQTGVVRPTVVVALAKHRQLAEDLCDNCPVVFADLPLDIPRATRRALAGQPGCDTEAAILFTSGTTGRPKGCLLSNGYMLAAGSSYATGLVGGEHAFGFGGVRIYCPLPLHHVAALCMVSAGMMLSGNCVILPDRFRPSRLLPDIRHTRATALHYLGIVTSTLLAMPKQDDDRDHGVRFALGAGADHSSRQTFRERFGIPCFEGWGMTETGRTTWSVSPRTLATNCIGHPRGGLQISVVDETGVEVATEIAGELRLRWGGSEGPRWGFFSGYCGDADATEESWRDGWFWTGDCVFRDADDNIFFVDRKKNIIRRSGENIAAAEVEQVLLDHPGVAQVAVVAVPDEIRQEEVLACLVLATEPDSVADAIADILQHCHSRLTYYKVPGWIYLTRALPTTSTQKITKSNIFPGSPDPRWLEGMLDVRDKKRPPDRTGP